MPFSTAELKISTAELFLNIPTPNKAAEMFFHLTAGSVVFNLKSTVFQKESRPWAFNPCL